MEEIFRLLEIFLQQLTLHRPQPRTIYIFEIKLLAELGLKPDLAASKLTPGARQLLGKFLSDEWPALLPIKISPAQDAELDRFLRAFLLQHLGAIPRGRDAALNISDGR